MNFYKLTKSKENFYSYDGNHLSNDSYAIIADPTYDLTFKDLFSQSKFWKENIVSLLGSLLFKEEIKNIQVLNNEFIDFDINKNNYGEHLKELKSDLSFKCQFKIGDNYNIVNLLNIEMQLGFPENFFERLIDYGIALRNKERPFHDNKKDEKYKTFVIGFINTKEKCKINSSAYYLSKFDFEQNTFIEKVNDFIDIIIINLSDISDKLIKQEKIFILGNEINIKGKNWLKLLSLRHWAIKTNKYYYKIPNLDIDEDINHAIKYLRDLTNKDQKILDTIYAKEEDYSIKIKNAVQYFNKEFIEEKSIEIAKENVAKLTKNEVAKLAKDELSKKYAEILGLENIIETYKTLNLKFEDLEKIKNFKYLLKEENEKTIDEIWGKEEPEKLNELKIFIGKKRKTIDKNVD